MKKVALVLILIFISIGYIYAQDNNFAEDELEQEFSQSSENYQVCDPLYGYNEKVTKLNDKLYFWVLKPTAKGYSKIIPKGVRSAIVRFFKNITFPIRFVNSILQFKFKKAGIEISRFVVNSTVGLAGFFDPARSWFHLSTSPEDTGQTLGFYGFKRPIHLDWPFLGPSNTRDTIGMVGDWFLNPIDYIPHFWWVTAIYVFKKINYTSLHIGEYEKLKKESVDFYPFLRDLYEQNRLKLIKE